MAVRYVLAGPRRGWPGCIVASSIAVALLLPALALASEDLNEDYSCVTEPYKDAVLSLSLSGRIERIPVQEGQQVKQGAPLVHLESQVEELEVKRRELIWQDKSELEVAAAQEEAYQQLLDSTQKLFEATKSVSQEELIKMELQYRGARAEHERLRIAEQREEVEYQLAKAQFERRTLSAPFAGVIVEITLQEGESCDPNQELVQLVDTSKGILTCNVEERIGRQFSANQSIPIRIATGDGYWQGEGKVLFASPLVDSASGLMRLKLAFDNRGGQVRPGVPGYIVVNPSN